MEHLIPSAWFTGLPWYILLITTAAAILVLSKGADWLVDGASGIAYSFGIPKVIVGATIIAVIGFDCWLHRRRKLMEELT